MLELAKSKPVPNPDQGRILANSSITTRLPSAEPPAYRLERPKLLYNRVTRRYGLYFHLALTPTLTTEPNPDLNQVSETLRAFARGSDRRPWEAQAMRRSVGAQARRCYPVITPRAWGRRRAGACRFHYLLPTMSLLAGYLLATSLACCLLLTCLRAYPAGELGRALQQARGGRALCAAAVRRGAYGCTYSVVSRAGTRPAAPSEYSHSK